MTVKEFATLIATSSMTDVEREQWLEALPILPQKVLLELGECLKEEQQAAEKLKAKYLAKAQKIVDKAKAAKLKAAAL